MATVTINNLGDALQRIEKGTLFPTFTEDYKGVIWTTDDGDLVQFAPGIIDIARYAHGTKLMLS